MTRVKAAPQKGVGNRSVALIRSPLTSSWVSCQSILRNLMLSYRDVFCNGPVKTFTWTETPDEVKRTAQRIFQFAPERIVFVDHQPHPSHLLMELKKVYGANPIPPLYFQIYGDFTVATREWLRVAELLKGLEVKFICASPRQRALVGAFMNHHQPLAVCPYPVDTKQFYFDLKLRQKWRKKLRLKEDERAVIYAGRVSLQKNVLKLLENLFLAWQKSKNPMKVFLAGEFDDWGAPFFGVHYKKGFYTAFWKERLEKFPKEFLNHVRFLGNLSTEDLCGLYNAGDVFASLSLHHDEDFGMAPAEALCCGLSALLTDWGGYSFFEKEGVCELVPVTLEKGGLRVWDRGFSQTLERLMNHPTQDRGVTSRWFQERVSIGAATKILQEIHREPLGLFSGFGPSLKRHAQMLVRNRPFPDGIGPETFYEQIYGGYLRGNESSKREKFYFSTSDWRRIHKEAQWRQLP